VTFSESEIPVLAMKPKNGIPTNFWKTQKYSIIGLTGLFDFHASHNSSPAPLPDNH